MFGRNKLNWHRNCTIGQKLGDLSEEHDINRGDWSSYSSTLRTERIYKFELVISHALHGCFFTYFLLRDFIQVVPIRATQSSIPIQLIPTDHPIWLPQKRRDGHAFLIFINTRWPSQAKQGCSPIMLVYSRGLKVCNPIWRLDTRTDISIFKLYL